MDKHPKSPILCTVPPTSWAAGLGCGWQSSARLLSAQLGIGWAWAQLRLGSPPLLCSLGCSLHRCCSVCAPLGSAVIAAWSCVLPEGWEGMGSDERGTKSAGMVLATSLRKKRNKMAPLPERVPFFFSRKPLSPEMKCMVLNSNLAPSPPQHQQEKLGHLFST